MDLRRFALGQVKMEALDGSAAIWSYSGTIYAMRLDVHPTAILAIASGTAS